MVLIELGSYQWEHIKDSAIGTEGKPGNPSGDACCLLMRLFGLLEPEVGVVVYQRSFESGISTL